MNSKISQDTPLQRTNSRLSNTFSKKENISLKLQFLKEIEFFKPLPESTLKLIAQSSSDICLQTDEILFKEGDLEESVRLYIILSGNIEIYKGMNIRKCVSILGPGQCVGEMAMIDNQPRSASALALNDVLLMEINDEIFHKYIASDSKVLLEMMKVFTSRMRNDLDIMSSDLKQVCNFTHDMRNILVPLSIAESLLENMLIVLNGSKENHKKRDGGEIVEKSFNTMVSVKNNLVTLIDQSLACIKKTKIDYVKSESEIYSLAKETIDEVSCHKYLKGKKVIIKSNAENLKKGHFNSLDIKRVLQNLIINAGYVTEKAGTIEISLDDLEGFNIITVKDDGEGIPEDVQNILLKDNFTSKPDGNGFGLMACREIIEDFHNGKIWFESQVGKGTSFYFTVPHYA